MKFIWKELIGSINFNLGACWGNRHGAIQGGEKDG